MRSVSMMPVNNRSVLIRIPIAIFLLLSLSVAAQQRNRSQPSDTIPFLLTDYNNIAVKAVLNQQDTVLLMFHTAASFLTLTEDAVKKLKTIRFTGTTDSIKSWGGQANSARFSTNNRLQIGSMQWDSITLWENQYSGQYTDGKFGINLFDKKAIEIDFDNRYIVLSKHLPANTAGFEKLALRVQQEDLLVEASCIVAGNQFHHPFLIHSGYAGALLLDDQFANENKLGEQLTITGEKQLKDSYANEAVIWDFFLNNDLLNNTDQDIIKNYIGESPKTQELGEGSPGNIGSFSGWQIVKKYMEKNSKTSLKELMKMNAREIYNQSKYKPRT